MSKSRILRDFMRMPDSGLETFAGGVSIAMKDNPDFPGPIKALDDMEVVRQEYSALLAASKSGDRVAGAGKNDAKAKLKAALLSLAFYVEAVANGNRKIMLGAGFNVTAEVKTSPAMNSINNFKAEHGTNSGEMVLSAARVRGAASYEFYYAVADGDVIEWHHVSDTKSKITLTDLQVGKTHLFYIKAIGAKGKYVQSITITKVVS